MNLMPYAAVSAVVAGLGYLALRPRSDMSPTVMPEPAPAVLVSEVQSGPPVTFYSAPEVSQVNANGQPSVAAVEDLAVDDTEVRANAEEMTDSQREERVRELLVLEGSDVAKYVEVQSIACEQGACTVEAVAKGTPSEFQMSMARLLDENAWLGNTMNINTAPDNRGIATFRFYKE